MKLIPNLTSCHAISRQLDQLLFPASTITQRSEQQNPQHLWLIIRLGSSVQRCYCHPLSLTIALLTISDSRTLQDDASGDQLQQSLEKAGHQLYERCLCQDDRYHIRAELSRWIADPYVDVVITNGGTGLTGRDGTPEAIEPLLDKRVEGFGELFRVISFNTIGTSTLQSRCLAGVANGTFVFVLPGSIDAVTTAWESLIKAQLDASTKPCNLAQLRGRLKESAERPVKNNQQQFN